MMLDAERLHDLMPAIYRIRDDEQGGPLKALLSVIAEQLAVLEADLTQLYDDQFIETCAEWVVPYIGDLIGYRALHGDSTKAASQRACVAHTIAYRRRKGTATVLEQLARDMTGWDARAVEFFRLLATTQHVNHVRPQNVRTPDLRAAELLEHLQTPFDTVAHTAEVRCIASGRGKYNIPNVGLFLWRLRAYPLTQSPAVILNGNRYFISPLGCDMPLFTCPISEEQITHLAEPINVPDPISRLRLRDDLGDYYGQGRSILVEDDNGPVAPRDLGVCSLADVDPADPSKGWAHTPLQPTIKVAIDPVLGRLAFRDPPTGVPRVTFHYGFSMDMGGGEYERANSLVPDLQPTQNVTTGAKIQAALTTLDMRGLVEIGDSGRYEETLSMSVAENKRLELRAANGFRPTLVLGGEMAISGDQGSEVTIDGLLITGGPLRVSGQLHRLCLRHCTLVPGSALAPSGKPNCPDRPSLIIDSPGTEVEIDHCIVGGLRVADDAAVTISSSIVDSTIEDGVAYAGAGGSDPGAVCQELPKSAAGAKHTSPLQRPYNMRCTADPGPGGDLKMTNSTVIGRVHARRMVLASNVIFLARLAEKDSWQVPVRVERRQEGCVRFSFVPLNSLTPRRYRCQPETDPEALRVRPQFTSLRYGDPGYCQLSSHCATEIRQGADDEAEMGAFHDLYQPQRETNLRVAMDEYLRLGLEAGILYVT